MIQSSDRDSTHPIEKVVDPFSREEADTGPHGVTQSSGTRSSSHDKGPLIRNEHINQGNCGRVKRHKARQIRTKQNESDSLSDIDDAEVIGYLNTKVEMNYKRILWEAMNGKQKAAKKQKRIIDTKTSDSIKKAGKTARKVEIQRPSSRINYDALKTLNDEWNSDTEMAQLTRTKFDTHRTGGSPDKNIRHGYDDDQQDISQDNQTFGHYTEHMHNEEYGDENIDDTYIDLEEVW